MKVNLKKAAIGTLIGIMTISPMTVMAQEQGESFLSQMMEKAVDTQAEETAASEVNTSDIQLPEEIDEQAIREEIDGLYDQVNVLYSQIDELYAQIDELEALLPECKGDVEFTEEEEAVWEKISACYDRLYELYPANVDIWEKLYEGESPVIDEKFDELDFISESKNLTDTEKKTLTDQVAEEEKIYREMDELWEEFYALDEDYIRYDFEEDENYLWNKVNTLYGRQIGVKTAHSEIWDKIDDAFYEKYEYSVDVDIEKFIKEYDVLTEEEKAIALADNKLINIFDEQANILLNSIYEVFDFEFDGEVDADFDMEFDDYELSIG